MDSIRRRPDGTIDCEFYISQSRERWARYPSDAAIASGSRALSPRPKRHLKSWALVFVLATAAFWLN